jgi:hypothetical protein
MTETKDVLYIDRYVTKSDTISDEVYFLYSCIMVQTISKTKPVRWTRKTKKLQSTFGVSKPLVDFFCFVYTETLLLYENGAKPIILDT